MKAWYLRAEGMTASQAAIERMADSCSTRQVCDLAMQALIIRGAGDDRDYAIRCILDRRAEWLTYLTMQQRKWQGNTRRPSRARHHDSIAIREQYVRVAA